MEQVYLRALAKRYPDVADVLAELANLEAILTLPKPAVHVVSDVHGEHEKLQQVIHNASGSLRPLVVQVLGDDKTLPLIYFPLESWMRVIRETGHDPSMRQTNLSFWLAQASKLMRELAKRYTLKYVERIIPDPFDDLFRELMFGHEVSRAPDFFVAMIKPILEHGRDTELVRTIAHVIRDLAVGELVVAGDLGDRGPRIDKVIELLEHQPNVSITWGNHDADWMAACLGCPAAIATVVRLSLRYQRLSQLEEGYGILLQPLEQLARAAYEGDPATQFAVKGDPVRDPLLLARMQKAAAILQFKLEGALFRRRAEWKLEHRALLHRIDPKTGTIELEGTRYPLLDTRLPTIDWGDPYALSADEERCLTELVRAFTESQSLWRQMRFVASHGQMWLRRDLCAIFHGCVPVDERGDFLAFPIDGEPRAGRALFEALERVVQRAFLRRDPADVELVFYLWTGPLSPCFGKDKMATFETYFLADKATYEETKNPYFKLIHDGGFCARVLREFGVDEREGFLVNGHVPVKLDKGEAPIKKSGRAITIDGAFAAAYGDKGFSLVLDAQRMYLAQHHHLDHGGDIIPTVSDVQVYSRPRLVGDTEKGDELRAEIAALEELVTAFECNQIRPVG